MNNIVFNLVVTEKCNLGCKYCYMNNRNNNMSTEVIDALYDNRAKILDLFGGKTYNIDFFGGEPLLNKDIIKYTVNKFSNVDDITFMCIISNMLAINDEFARYIKDNNIGVSWSFDGLWNENIRTIYSTGDSSICDYVEKLDLIKSLTNSCRCTITSFHMNTDITLSENFRFIMDGLGIIPDYAVSKDFGWTSETVDKFLYQLEEFADLYIDTINTGTMISNFFSLYLADTILYKKTQKRDFSCFAGQNGVCIMPNGDIYPCARYGTNCLSCMGNIMHPETIKPFEYKDALNPVKFEECMECEMYGWCNSGCQFAQQCNGFKPIPEYCRLYKGIYKKALYVYNKLRNNSDWIRQLHYEYDIVKNNRH